MSENIFHDLTTIEADQKQLESIDRLQQAFADVRQNYRREYQDSLQHVLANVKNKMKSNEGMVEAVNIYVSRFVSADKEEEATEELYNLLAAEMLQTMHALQHTTCCVM
jgi:hypothetical protein